ncbi:hypothetical protein PN462_02715 [Spirulina sp. CS-785/01]|uniref:hypothetical protein n=1 Tax=Spirulina sp. CS-785/01 TaxID=3021716 RepID=UPI00232BF472|nr:hypothetical protein [Spirulina sp. CS-785/01]MDB9311999.1 hypothetical protein [Spirulina sp. CS-785/01]
MMLPIFPLLLLVFALGNLFLYQRSSHDVYRVLTAAIAVVCLIWGFALAHWSIHLLSLVLLLKFRDLPLERLERHADS